MRVVEDSAGASAAPGRGGLSGGGAGEEPLAAEATRGVARDAGDEQQQGAHQQQRGGAEALRDARADQPDEDVGEGPAGADEAIEALGLAGVEQLVGEGPELHQHQRPHHLHRDVDDVVDARELEALGGPQHDEHRPEERGGDQRHQVSAQARGVAAVQQPAERHEDCAGDVHPRQLGALAVRQEQRVAHRAPGEEGAHREERMEEEGEGESSFPPSGRQHHLENAQQHGGESPPTPGHLAAMKFD